MDQQELDQINADCALAQGWELDSGCWDAHDNDGLIPVESYTPTTNGQQAMELVKVFKMCLDNNSDEALAWIPRPPKEPVYGDGPTSEIAICKSVQAMYMEGK